MRSQNTISVIELWWCSLYVYTFMRLCSQFYHIPHHNKLQVYEGIICQGYFDKRKWKSTYLNCNISLWNMVNLIYFTSFTECGPFNIFCLKFLYISLCVTAWKGIQNSEVKGHWFQIWNSYNVAKITWFYDIYPYFAIFFILYFFSYLILNIGWVIR